ncbi:MAG TPA: ornithine--oxo-acid transaminase [Acidobacteriaceae bacterium]|nr:ornithine--oxo-acid transaminase [Acidobacteriaceae bacterium]
MLTTDYIELEQEYGAHNYHPLDVVIERAQGIWVYDTGGNRYLDCLSAYSALNQGHCHPRILDAMIEQAQTLTLTSRAFRNTQLPRLYEDLHNLTGFDMALPMNSGTEAVETAIKAARKWGAQVKGIPENQAEIIVCTNNFHGRTIAVVSFSSEDQYKQDFGPFLPGFRSIPFGDAAALRAAITPNTCAFLVEPIQGEAGILIPPAGYLSEVDVICKSNNVLLILDEIQSGLGRTGRMFAFEHAGIRPDVVTIGKALSGGFYPVSAVLSSRQVLGCFQPGDHGSTFGGNPLACAIARAALRVIVDERLCERSAELGPFFLDELRKIQSPVIKTVRGLGLWLAMELNEPARPYCEALKHEGILCKETHGNIIRLAPPLIIEKADILWATERIRAVIESMGGKR